MAEIYLLYKCCTAEWHIFLYYSIVSLFRSCVLYLYKAFNVNYLHHNKTWFYLTSYGLYTVLYLFCCVNLLMIGVPGGLEAQDVCAHFALAITTDIPCMGYIHMIKCFFDWVTKYQSKHWSELNIKNGSAPPTPTHAGIRVKPMREFALFSSSMFFDCYCVTWLKSIWNMLV